MASLDQIIQRAANPFDPVTFITGNFWNSDIGAASSTVKSIHQEAIEEIETVLDLVIQDNYTRSILLQGDSGCGKSYLLARLKKTFNSKAFFAYIGSCASSDYIWRHTLRQVVDSLMHVPEGETDSQLLLWLKGLSAFRDRSLMKRMLGERGLFMLNFRNTYPTGIYQANDFFNVLYQLTNPKLFIYACDWLRGENLDREQLKLLKVKSVIDSEIAAKGIISNFGRIAADTKPIVLCFDQVETGPRLADNYLSLSPYFDLNTSFYNDNVKNFVVLISIVRNIWSSYKGTIPQSDLSRVCKFIDLKNNITWEQVKALWSLRLHPLHCQAQPKPESPIAPLDGLILEKRYPGGKVNLRNSLILGKELFFKYKLRDAYEEQSDSSLAGFKLLWQQEFNQNQAKIKRIRNFSSLELIEMLKQTLKTMGIKIIKNKLLASKNSRSYSFSCQLPGTKQNMGIIWYEEPNLSGLFYLMKACQKALEQNLCHGLLLIRGENLGSENNKGYQLFQQVFTGEKNRHIIPELDSVSYLRTYQALANDAIAGDLVVGSQTPSLEEVEQLTREAKILERCSLLLDLGLVIANNEEKIEKVEKVEEVEKVEKVEEIEKVDKVEKVEKLQKIEKKDEEGKKEKLPFSELNDFILNLVETQQLISVQVVIANCTKQFPGVTQAMVVDKAIKDLAEAKLVRIMNLQAKLEEKLVSWVPR